MKATRCFGRFFCVDRPRKQPSIVDTYAALESLRCISTVVDATTSDVLFQNRLSREYYGVEPGEVGCRLLDRLANSGDLVDWTATSSRRTPGSTAEDLLRVGSMMQRVPISCNPVTSPLSEGWHMVTVSPASGAPGVVVISQTDMTAFVAHSDMLDHTLGATMPEHALLALRRSHTSGKSMDLEAGASAGVNASTARAHEDVTVMFMDVVGFTSMADTVSPTDVMAFVNDLFGALDRLLEAHPAVHKVETAGDCYIVAAGVVTETSTTRHVRVLKHHDAAKSAAHVFDFALAALERVASIKMPNDDSPTRVRIGMHTGPIVSGLVGCTLPKFGLFGDTMNVAARMEQTAPEGAVHMTCDAFDLVSRTGRASSAVRTPGGVLVKGKPKVVSTYVWRRPLEDEE